MRILERGHDFGHENIDWIRQVRLTDSDGSRVQDPEPVAFVGLYPVRSRQTVAVTFLVVCPTRVRCQFRRSARGHVQRHVVQRRGDS